MPTNASTYHSPNSPSAAFGLEVAAARTLKEYMDQAEERAKDAENDLMRDQSSEIKAVLEYIREERASLPAPSAQDGISGSFPDS